MRQSSRRRLSAGRRFFLFLFEVAKFYMVICHFCSDAFGRFQNNILVIVNKHRCSLTKFGPQAQRAELHFVDGALPAVSARVEIHG